MRVFTDKRGRRWSFDLSIGAAERIKAGLKIDLANVGEDSIGVIAADPYTITKIIASEAVLEDPNGISTELPLADALAGDSLAEARTAFLEELIDFFQKPVQRQAVRRATEAYDQALEQVFEKFTDKIASGELTKGVAEAMDREMERALTTASASTSGASSGDSPASSP